MSSVALLPLVTLAQQSSSAGARLRLTGTSGSTGPNAILTSSAFCGEERPRWVASHREGGDEVLALAGIPIGCGDASFGDVCAPAPSLTHFPATFSCHWFGAHGNVSTPLVKPDIEELAVGSTSLGLRVTVRCRVPATIDEYHDMYDPGHGQDYDLTGTLRLVHSFASVVTTLPYDGVHGQDTFHFRANLNPPPPPIGPPPSPPPPPSSPPARATAYRLVVKGNAVTQSKSIATREAGNAECASFAQSNGFTGHDWRIVVSMSNENAKDYITYRIGDELRDQAGSLLTAGSLWNVYLGSASTHVMTATNSQGNYVQCGSQGAAWPLCQWCNKEWGCNAYSPFTNGACCQSGNRMILCIGATN